MGAVIAGLVSGGLLLLGDSLAAGLQAHLAPAEAHVRSGASSFERWERHARPGSVVVLVVGANDAPGPALATRFAALIGRLAAGSGRLVVAGPPCAVAPDIDRRLAAVAALQREAVAAAQPRADWLPLRDVTQDGAGRCRAEGRAADGLHFTAAGYGGLAMAVQSVLGGMRR